MSSSVEPLSDDVVPLIHAFFTDVVNAHLDTPKNNARDLRTCLTRYKNEGFAFLSKTLPAIGKAFESSLESGILAISGLKTRYSVPVFLRGLFKRVFDNGGTILCEPNPDAIKYIRQLCYLCYKVEFDYSDDVVQSMMEDFINDDIKKEPVKISPKIHFDVARAQYLVWSLFKDFDPYCITPRPGPGQTADKVEHWYRNEPSCLVDDIHQCYPYYRYFYLGRDHLIDRVRSYRALPRVKRGCARVVPVPKDSRGPRLICMFPADYMYFQQGLGRAMIDHIESHPLTRGRLNFKDQSVNANLALLSSVNQDMATLDMKNASDNVMLWHVEILFARLPKLLRCLKALTTDLVQIGSTVHSGLNKYAPMGSALCFPVMSVVHYVLGLCATHGEKERISFNQSKFFVYGDDIVVKTEYVENVFRLFSELGLVFNKTKSFFKGHFRESCGTDAFMGVNVTPVKLKKRGLVWRKCGEDLTALTEISRLFMEKGFLNLSNHFSSKLRSLGVNYPGSTIGLPCDVELEHFPLVMRKRKAPIGSRTWCEATQQWVCKVFSAHPQRVASSLGGWEQLISALNHKREGSEPYYKQYTSKLRVCWKPLHSI